RRTPRATLFPYTTLFRSAGQRQSVFGKTFAPFGLAEGRNFMEYDLIYVQGDYLFWGARNVDGRGFDTERNRPTNLQIPLGRKRRSEEHTSELQSRFDLVC